MYVTRRNRAVEQEIVRLRKAGMLNHEIEEALGITGVGKRCAAMRDRGVNVPSSPYGAGRPPKGRKVVGYDPVPPRRAQGPTCSRCGEHLVHKAKLCGFCEDELKDAA